MILEVDAKIDHDNMLNAIRQSAAEAMVYRQEELLLDKRFVAAEQNLHTHTHTHTHTQFLIHIKLLCPASMLQSGLKPLILNSMSYNDLKRGIE